MVLNLRLFPTTGLRQTHYLMHCRFFVEFYALPPSDEPLRLISGIRSTADGTQSSLQFIFDEFLCTAMWSGVFPVLQLTRPLSSTTIPTWFQYKLVEIQARYEIWTIHFVSSTSIHPFVARPHQFQSEWKLGLSRSFCWGYTMDFPMPDLPRYNTLAVRETVSEVNTSRTHYPVIYMYTN